MTRFVALLRAVNLGPSSTLPMADLKRLCEEQGWENVRTYIASGNVVFDAEATEAKVKAGLERALQAYAEKSIGVLVRSGGEMAAVLAANPYPDVPGNRAVAIFLDEPPPKAWREAVKGQRDERLEAGQREIYVHYPSGQGTSKLRIPAVAEGTARNMNTVAKLAEMAAEPPHD